MANYNVDIAVAVRNLDALKGFKRELTSVQRAVDDFNNKTLSVDERKLKAIARKREDASLKALQRVAAADLKALEGLAKKEQELEDRLFKDKLKQYEEETKLQEAQFKKQVKDEDKVFKQRLKNRLEFDKKVETSAKSMIDGVRKVNEGAKQLDDLQTQKEIKNDDIVFRAKLDKYKQETRVMMQDIKRRGKFDLDDFNDRLREKVRLRRAAERKAEREASGGGTARRGKGRINAAVTAGAFPLLFGGGPGTAIGGALGGLASGQLFGGLTVVGQVLGGAIDKFVGQLSLTGQALNEFTFDFTEVVRAAGLAGTATASYIEKIESLADATEAQEFATKALAVRVGNEGVESIKAFGEASADLGREFSTATTIFGAALASLVSPLTEFTAKVLEANNALVAGRANATDDAELTRLVAREAQLQGGLVGGRTQGRSVQNLKDAEELRKVQEQIRDRQREILFITEQTAKIRAEDLQLLENEKSVQTDSLRVLALRRGLLMSGKELTEEQVVELEKQILKAKFLEEKQRLINQAKLEEISFRKAALKIAGLELDLAEDLKNLEDKDTKKTGPKSRALQLQAAILQEQLKQLNIETQSQSLSETTVQNLRRQNQNIEERQAKELKILGFQRQQELANNKVAGDAKFINELYDEREQTIRDTLGLELAQNKARIDAIELQQKLTRMRANQQTAGIGRGLRRDIADAQRGLANPFDSNELQMLQLRVDQVRRAEDAYQGLNDKILENTAIINDNRSTEDEIDRAEKENKVLRDRIDLYRQLLPELDAVEQAQLRQKQIIDQLTPATDAFAGALIDTVTGAQTAQQAFANFLQSVANMLADTAKKMISQYIAIGIARMFAGMGGVTDNAGSNLKTITEKYGTFGAEGAANAAKVLPPLPPMALGGQVGAGKAYLVGERGPEMFIPGAQGNIVPNSAMGSANVTVNVDASGSSVEGNADQASQLGKAIGVAVQQELIKQKRPGGLLAS